MLAAKELPPIGWTAQKQGVAITLWGEHTPLLWRLQHAPLFHGSEIEPRQLLVFVRFVEVEFCRIIRSTDPGVGRTLFLQVVNFFGGVGVAVLRLETARNETCESVTLSGADNTIYRVAK
jgi:hypothetical protein